MSAPTVPAGASRIPTSSGASSTVDAARPRRRSVAWTPRDAFAFLAAGMIGGGAAGLVTWWVMSTVTIPIHI